MPTSPADLFIVDNSDQEWKVWSYLSEWCELSRTIDIATGYFEIGALLSLKEKWQSVDTIRILLGDEVSYRTKRAFAEGLKKATQRLDASIEGEKLRNDFLEGVPAIVEAIRSGQIQCRVYRKDKFHAKCYITHARQAVIGSYALVGSSNFTYPGLSDNVELNIQVRGSEVRLLQEWYERYWDESEDITPDILRTLERHTQPRAPFEVYFKGLYEYFRGEALTPDLWDRNESRMFPELDKYQQDAYKNLVTIAKQYRGAFLCDGVGLGKTFVGLMLLERMVVCEGKRVVLMAPKAAREDVWEGVISHYLPTLNSGFVNFILFNHTDLQRGGAFQERMEMTLRDADVIIIDEAHHFRNPGIKGEGVQQASRYRRLQQFLHGSDRPKQLFMLTATPVNNSIHDFRHLIELFTNGTENYFSSQLGIHNVRGHFRVLEKRLFNRAVVALESAPELNFVPETNMVEAETTLRTDPLFETLVVQRSRAYVKRSQLLAGATTVLFPERSAPQVVDYSLKTTYGRLLESVEKAFSKDRPLFVLSIYYPLAYWIGDKESAEYESFSLGRQKQVVTLIRTLFLKRFESSSEAFKGSCWRLMLRLLAWTTAHAVAEIDGENLLNDSARKRLERWKLKNAALTNYAHAHQQELWPSSESEGDDADEELLSQDQLDAVVLLDPAKYDVEAIFNDSLDDLAQLAEFLERVEEVKPNRDDKLRALIKLLKTDKVLKKGKVLLFTEFADTARYLEKELKEANLEGVHRIDGSSTQKHRSSVIKRFSPYYNNSSSATAEAHGGEIRVLISTDVLAEGLNLQDATRLINYDLHWNPVRLMQRIGRVDRRMNKAVEARLVHDHPDQKALRGKVEFWNFLPPDELDELLRLFQRVASKTLTISRTLGIEGSKLLTPNDTFDPIRELNEQFDGSLTDTEQLRLEYNKLVLEHPELATELPNLPLKMYSGKTGTGEGRQAVFFCYRIPRPDTALVETEDGSPRWSDAAGLTVWACYDIAGQRVLADPGAMAAFIRSTPDTPRHCVLDRIALAKVRGIVEKQLVVDYLRPLQAPVGVSPVLKCWMEIN